MNTIQNANKNDLLGWYTETFIPEPNRGYALMCPLGARAKYSRKNESCTLNVVAAAFNGATRRLPIDGTWHTFERSIAITPEHRNGWATMATIDVDGGGKDAINRALKGLRKMGLWAFAQLGKSQDHSGGHIYIPSSAQLPAPMLREVAEEIMRRYDIAGEAYPCNRDLRLPLMMHLHAPGPLGPRRYPLMIQDGQTIDATDPWTALAELRQQWQANDPEAMTAIIPKRQTTDTAKATCRKPIHKSKVRPGSIKSVINWYNARHDLADVLGVERGIVRCPWHDDKKPSLAVWQHDDGRTVCRCLSQHSGCAASSDSGYWDAFNLYCHENNLAPADAVKQISKEHGLGNKRRFKVETRGQKEPCIEELIAHPSLVDKARGELRQLLDRSAESWGKIMIIKATCGGGKTYTAARRANRSHNQGKTVSIVVPSHKNATQEWAPKLNDAHIWQPRAKLCTCHDKDYLQTVANLGYTVPKCTDTSCPYLQQFEHRKGKITIYQHNHLYINHGALLEGSDLIIVDESPLNALLEERTVNLDNVLHTMNELRRFDPTNDAIYLLDALASVAAQAQKEKTPLIGDALIQRLAEYVGGREELKFIISCVQDTTTASLRPLAPIGISPGNLRPQFLGRLIEALKHDLHEPDHNPLLAWTQNDGKWQYAWYKRHDFLAGLYGQLTSPSVIILDGSADEDVYRKLLSPWQVEMVEISLPLSPMVRVVQATKTSSTRKIVHDDDLARRTLRQVAQLANELDITLDGGITYQGITETAQDMLGGHWLHYGGQRGSNDLAGAKAIALIASPTAPPDAIERKAQALYHDEPRLSLEWERRGVGYYVGTDPRLESMNRIHGPEEMLQSLHRSRPVLSHTPSTILVCSPWPLAEIGIQPNTIISEMPHGNSAQARTALTVYRDRTGLKSTQGLRADWGGGLSGVPAKKSTISIRESREESGTGRTSPSKKQLDGGSPPPSLINGELKSPKKLQQLTPCKPKLPVTTTPKPLTSPPQSAPCCPELDGLRSKAEALGWPRVSVLGQSWSGEKAWRGWLSRYRGSEWQIMAAQAALEVGP